jgi:uncharacterized protein (TIGR03086 family)
MTELIALFQRAADGFGKQVHSIGEGEWHQPTACSDWDVRTLVNHVAVEQLWVPPLVDGSTVADIGNSLDGDQLGNDPVAAWDAAVKASSASFGAAGALNGTVSLSRGPMPTADYCWEMTADALVHSWDLARGIGGDEKLDGELVEAVYERMLPHAQMLAESGMFAPPVPVPDNAPLQTKLLGVLGRRA